VRVLDRRNVDTHSAASVVWLVMLATIAVIASIHGHGITLIVLFFASFFPIGLFLLGVPGWMWVIGVLNVGYLIAGLVAWRMPHVIERSESSDT